MAFLLVNITQAELNGRDILMPSFHHSTVRNARSGGIELVFEYRGLEWEIA